MRVNSIQQNNFKQNNIQQNKKNNVNFSAVYIDPRLSTLENILPLFKDKKAAGLFYNLSKFVAKKHEDKLFKKSDFNFILKFSNKSKVPNQATDIVALIQVNELPFKHKLSPEYLEQIGYGLKSESSEDCTDMFSSLFKLEEKILEEAAQSNYR